MQCGKTKVYWTAVMRRVYKPKGEIQWSTGSHKRVLCTHQIFLLSFLNGMFSVDIGSLQILLSESPEHIEIISVHP